MLLFFQKRSLPRFLKDFRILRKLLSRGGRGRRRDQRTSMKRNRPQPRSLNPAGTGMTGVVTRCHQRWLLRGLYRQSGILTDAAAQEDLTAQITEETATEKSLLPGSTIFSPCLPSVISVISVVKSCAAAQGDLQGGWYYLTFRQTSGTTLILPSPEKGAGFVVYMSLSPSFGHL